MITVEVVTRITVETASPAEAEAVGIEAIDLVSAHPSVNTYWVCSSEVRQSYPMLVSEPAPVPRGSLFRRTKRTKVGDYLVIVESEEPCPSTE